MNELIALLNEAAEQCDVIVNNIEDVAAYDSALLTAAKLRQKAIDLEGKVIYEP